MLEKIYSHNIKLVFKLAALIIFIVKLDID